MTKTNPVDSSSFRSSNGESKILGPAESLSIPYRPRHTRLTEVRSVNDWQLKIYQITLDGEPISSEVVQAAMECVAQRSIWPTDLEHQCGFVRTTNPNEG